MPGWIDFDFSFQSLLEESMVHVSVYFLLMISDGLFPSIHLSLIIVVNEGNPFFFFFLFWVYLFSR